MEPIAVWWLEIGDSVRGGEATAQPPDARLRRRMKGLGYLISTISVGLLGIVAWPGPGEPRWKAAAVMVGMALSGGGHVRPLSVAPQGPARIERPKHMS